MYCVLIISFVGEEYCTASLIIPTVFGLYNKIQGKAVESRVAVKLKENLTEAIIQRLFPYEQRQALQIVTLLDPRMKKKAFRSLDNGANAQKLLEFEISNSKVPNASSDAKQTSISSSATASITVAVQSDAGKLLYIKIYKNF